MRMKDPYLKSMLTNLVGRDPNRVFSSTPAALRRLVRGLTNSQLKRKPSGGKWPIAWIIHHMCDAEVGMAFRIRMAMAQRGVRFQAFDQDAWSRGLHYDTRSVSSSLETFTALRRSHCELLSHSTRRDLSGFGIHAQRGRESVERIIHLLAGHDINHLRQIRHLRASNLRITMEHTGRKKLS